MSLSRRRFTQEFKDELCREVISTSKPIKDVAVAYGVGPQTLRNVNAEPKQGLQSSYQVRGAFSV
ncbi:MAG: transposase [Lacisediminihabitans sp.]